MNKINRLITGCGCSGTEFIATYLTKTGIPFCHEKQTKIPGTNNPRALGSKLIGISSWALAGQTDDTTWGDPYSTYNFKHIVHQVRCPLKCMTSFMTSGEQSMKFVQKNICIDDNDSLLTKAMKYWLYWNQKAENMSSWTYKIEDLEQNLEKLFEEIGLTDFIAKKGYKWYLEKFQSMKKNVGTRWANKEKKVLTWEDLRQEDESLTEQIKKQAKRYGYNIS